MVAYVILKNLFQSPPIHPTAVVSVAVRAPAYEGLVKRNGVPGRVPPRVSGSNVGGTPGFANSVQNA